MATTVPIPLWTLRPPDNKDRCATSFEYMIILYHLHVTTLNLTPKLRGFGGEGGGDTTEKEKD
jgi:hypothetical protein